MRHTTMISGRNATHRAEGVWFWVFAGIILVIAFGDAVTVVAAAVAIVSTIWWIYREVERRVTREAKMAHVTPLPPEPPGQHDAKVAPAPALWRGPCAA